MITRFPILLIISLILIGCNRDKTDQFQGYVDSKLRYISTNFEGLLLQLNVKEGDKIEKNQPLFALEEYPQFWSVEEASKQLEINKSQINEYLIKTTNIASELARREKLKTMQHLSNEELDVANTKYAQSKQEYDSARINLQINQNKLDTAIWEKNKKRVSAQVNGSIFDIYYYVGELVPAQRPVLSILSPEDIRIFFFVPEEKISQIKLGQAVSITCDGCAEMNAKVNYISPTPEFTPPTIYSEQTRGKMTFLIKALPNEKDIEKLHPGQPVSVSLVNN